MIGVDEELDRINAYGLAHRLINGLIGLIEKGRFGYLIQ